MEPQNPTPALDRAITLTKYIVVVGIIGLICASFVGFLLSSVETFELIWQVLTHLADPELDIQEVNFIKLVDGFLVATGLLIFGLGLFEIFIRPLPLQESLKFTSIEQLKSTLANIVILTLAVTFLAFVQQGDTAINILLKGVGIAVMIIVLVFFSRGQHREP